MQDDDLRYSKFSDILNILIKMQDSANGMSLDEIAKEACVSRRTAERIRNFILINFPNISEIPSKGRCKRWGVTNYTAQRQILLGLISFSDYEVMEIEKCRKMAKSSGKQESEKVLDSIKDKINLIRTKNKFDNTDSCSEFQQLMEAEGTATHRIYKHKYDQKFLRTIRKAVLTHRKLYFHYTNRRQEYSERLVMPYGLLYDEKTYLVANDTVMKYFDLNYIEDLKVVDEYFVPDRNFNLQKYIEQSFGIYQEEKIDVVVRFSEKAAKDVKNFIFHPSQVMRENKDGTIDLEFCACGKVAMCREFFKWGNKITILKPQELRDFYKKELQKALENLD